MDNYIESLSFNYKNGEVSSVRVTFNADLDDSVLISSKYIDELRKYYDISEADKEVFFIIARAIQLKKDNKKKIDGAGKRYNFGSKYEPFHEVFISKLIDLAKQVPLEIIASNFGYDAKVEDLDIFLNRKSTYSLALMMKSGISLSECNDASEDNDDDFD